jgi:hypothetical protein
MFGKYNGFVSKARVSACIYFLVVIFKQGAHISKEFFNGALWGGPNGAQCLTRLFEGPEGVSYSHFPAQILTKSHCLRAQIPSSHWLAQTLYNPIPISYCFFGDESQSQCMKSWHFPTKKISKSQFPFYPFMTLVIN